MAAILEVKAGPLAGKKIPVQKGQVVSVGRSTEKANVAVPHDDKMSRLHFKIECGAAGVRIVDCGAANGTFVNGSRISDTLVMNNDEVRAGDTYFVVKIVPDEQPAQVSDRSMVPPAVGTSTDATYKVPKAPPMAHPAPIPPHAAPEPLAPAMNLSQPMPAQPRPQPQAPPPPPPPKPVPAPQPVQVPPARAPAAPRAGGVRIGSWSFSKIPPGWEVQEGYGITYVTKDAFPSSIVATEEPLFGGTSLQQYVEAQVNMLRQYLREPLIEPALPPKIVGCEESVALEVRYTTKEKQNVFYRRIYARAGDIVAVLTLTSLENELGKFQPAFAEILGGAALEPKPVAG